MLRDIFLADCTHIGFAPPPLDGAARILKMNPWRDANGKFTSKEKAVYQGAMVDMHTKTISNLLVNGAITKDVLTSPAGKEAVKGMATAYAKYLKHMDASGGGVPATLKQFLNNHLYSNDIHTVADKVQASMNAQKAWVKIYQKKSLDALDNEYPKMLKDYMDAPEGKLKDKLAVALSKKTEFWSDQYTANGGDKAVFDSKLTAKSMEALNKKVEIKATADSIAASAKAGIAPKWADPHGGSTDVAKASNMALGVHYYKQRDSLGADHPDTKAAYDEWQKSKDWLKANGLGAKVSEFSSDAKAAAQKEIDHAKSAATKLQAEKDSALPNLQSSAYAMAMEKAKDPTSAAYANAAAMYQLAKMKADQHGFSAGMLNKYTALGNQAAADAHAKAQKFKEMLSGDLAAKVAYYDANAKKFKSYLGSSDKAYNEHVKNEYMGITTDQRDAISSYTSSGYSSQNKTLAGTKDSTHGAKDAQLVAEAMVGKTIGRDMLLRRNAPQKWFWQAMGIDESKMSTLSKDEMESVIGRTYTEKAFSSTSKDLNFSSAFSTTAQQSGAIRMNIRATADTRGIDVKDISSHTNEAEIVLDKGVTYVIRGIRPGDAHGYNGAGFKYIVDVDVIGHAE